MYDRHGRSGLISPQGTFLDRFRDPLPDFLDGVFQRLFRCIYEEDIPSRRGQHLRDAAPHLSRAYDPDGFDVVDGHNDLWFTAPR